MTQKAVLVSSATVLSPTSCGSSYFPQHWPAWRGRSYVPQVGIINPGEFAPLNSIEVVIWVAVGGRGVLYGAVAGALLVNYAKTYLTGALPEMWLYALGALFVLVTVLLPRGVMGLLPQARRRAS